MGGSAEMADGDQWYAQVTAFVRWMSDERGWRKTWIVTGQQVRPVGSVGAVLLVAANDREQS